MRASILRPLALLILYPAAGPWLPAKPTWGSLNLDSGGSPAPALRRLEGGMPLAFADGRTRVRLAGGEPVPAEVVYRLPPQGKHPGASQLRYLLTTTLQEPVWKFETRFACFDVLRIQPSGAGEALRYTADDSLPGEQARRDGPRTIRVSRRVMARLRVSRCRLALDIPVAGGEVAHIERDLPGQGGLAEPDTWGRDLPGSPDWARVFLHHPYPLRANQTPQPDDYLDAASARRLWKTILDRPGPGLDPDYRTTTNVALVHTFELDMGEFTRSVERCLAGAQLDDPAPTEAADKARREAQARAKAAQIQEAIAAIDQELDKLRADNDQLVAALDAEAGQLAGPFFEGFDAVPWPAKVYGFTTGSLLNFNRQACHYFYQVTAATEADLPVRRIRWSLGPSPSNDHSFVLDIRGMDRFQCRHVPGLPYENQYYLDYTNWRLTPDRTRMTVSEPFWQRPYLWDKEHGHLDRLQRLQALMAPYVQRCAEAKVKVDASLDRQFQLRRKRDQLRAQLPR